MIIDLTKLSYYEHAEKMDPRGYTGIVYRRGDRHGNQWFMAGYQYGDNITLRVVDLTTYYADKRAAADAARHMATQRRQRNA